MNDENNVKNADNRIVNHDYISEYKEKINEFNNKIDSEKNKMKELNDIENIIVSLNKSVNNCVDILRESMKGNNIDNKLNSIEESNIINLNKISGNIDIKRSEIKDRIISLTSEKEDYEDMFRENVDSNNNEEGE